MLKTGPAKEAVIETLPSPRLAMARLLLKSPTELPHAMTVIPKMLSSMPVMDPTKATTQTSSVAMKLIHSAARTKLMRQMAARPKGNFVPSLIIGGWPEGANVRATVPRKMLAAAAMQSQPGSDRPPTPTPLKRTQKGSPIQLATKKGLKYISLSTAGMVSVLASVKGISTTIITLFGKLSSLKKAQPSCLTLYTSAWRLSWLWW
mmetsp:Transcript_9858/g.24589  ORF Transcript_9858/g.24589 Transcript_9858/m.24589 type:complete len:205 (-) Transcript_9858:188-802(-)